MHDARLGLRALRTTPVISVVAVASLALSIGANTAIFSVVHALLLQSLPVSQPERLAMVSMSAAVSYRPQFSYRTFTSLLDHANFVDGGLAFTDCCGKSVATLHGHTELIDRQYVSGDFFTTLGVRAQRGRLIGLADNLPTAPGGPVVVVSDRFWRDRLGGAAAVAGMRVTIDRVPFTIVGVTPPDFFGLEVGRSFDIAVPVYLAAQLSKTPIDVDTEWLNVVLRLKSGMSIAAATAALDAIQPQVRATSVPQESPEQDFLKSPLSLDPIGRGTSALRQRFERPLLAMFAVTAFVLLIACANIGNLMLARSLSRRHELAVRIALGASRWRLVRQLLWESSWLAVLGAAFGLVVASPLAQLLVTQLSSSRRPIVLAVSLDWPMIAFATGMSVVTLALVGVVQVARATRLSPDDVLKAHSRERLGSAWTAASGSIIVGQVVLCLLLVMSAGLFVQALDRLLHVSLGFDPDRTLLVMANAAAIPAEDRNRFFRTLVDEAKALPGVAAAGASCNPPLVGTIVGDLLVSPAGRPPGHDATRISQLDLITPGWLTGYGTSIRAGRDFDDRDGPSAPPVMLVNEAFARRLFPAGGLVGTAVTLTARTPDGDFTLGSKTVVGIVENVVYRSVRDPIRPMVYLPMAQRIDPILQTTCFVGVRSATGMPGVLERTLDTVLSAAHPDIAFSVQASSQHVDESVAEDRLVAVLVSAVGGLALLLAALGLYGVVAYNIVLRRREIATRLALGATHGAIVRTVVARIVALVALGAAVGLTIGFWGLTYVRSLFYDLQSHDSLVLSASVAVVAVVALTAAGIAALGALRLEPASVLKDA